MKAAERHLYSLHNPTGTDLSFLLPVFTYPAGDNNLHIQTLDFDGTVAQFQVLTDDLPATPTDKLAIAQLGAPAIHAFHISNNETLVGTKNELIPSLSAILSDHHLVQSPLLRFYITQFCGITPQLSHAAEKAYSYLSAVSRYSADHWRDKTLLSALARISLARTLRDCKPLSSFDAPLNDISLSISGEEPHLLIPPSALSILNGTKWKSRLALDLAPYASAFNLDLGAIQLVVKSVTGEAYTHGAVAQKMAAARTIGRSNENLEDARWVVSAFGKRSTSAAKGLQGLSEVAIIPSEQEPDWGRAIEIIGAKDREKQTLNPVIIFDLGLEDTSGLMDLLEQFPRSSRPLGVGIYKVGEGSSGENDFVSERFSQFIVIPEGEAQNSNRQRRIPLQRSIRALFQMLKDSTERNTSSPSTLLFSMAYERRGIRNAGSAIQSAVAAAANEIVTPSTFHSARIQVSSVGRPDADEIYRKTLNACLSPRQDIPVAIEWEQKRFLSGGAVGTTVGILFSGDIAQGRPQEADYLDAAQAIFRAIGFQVEGREKSRFVVIGRSKQRLDVTAGVDDALAGDQFHVRIVRSRRSQLTELQEARRSKAIPLTLNDLQFFRESTSLTESARVLGLLAHETKTLPVELHPLIADSLSTRLRDPRSGFRFFEQIKDRFPSPEIKEVEVTIETVRREASRTAQLFGKATVGLTYGAEGDSEVLEDAVSALFVADIGPAGVQFRDIRLA